MFFSIGICHSAVIKMEYYLGKKSWWIWLVVGILEMHQQEQRVVKGWFPEQEIDARYQHRYVIQRQMVHLIG